jgi:hypothetical protein
MQILALSPGLAHRLGGDRFSQRFELNLTKKSEIHKI